MQRSSASSDYTARAAASDESWMGSDRPESAKTRSSRVFKVTATLVKRRSRRIILILLSVVYVLGWLMTDGAPFSRTPTELLPDSDTRIAEGGFRVRLLECLSLQRCAWMTNKWWQTRSDILEEDQQYLDSRQRELPRREEPHPDIRGWSVAKKQKTLQGLEWLIDNYDQRWPAERYQYARRFNRDVFIRLRDCMDPTSPSHYGTGEYNSTGIDSPCTAAEMTVVVLGNHNFGGSHEGRVSGENIWARSVIATFDQLGYSSVYAYEAAEWYDIHRAIPDLVRIIIADHPDITACQKHGRPEWLRVLSEEELLEGALVVSVQARAPGAQQARNYTSDEWATLQSNRPIEIAQDVIYYGHPRLRDQRSSTSPDALKFGSPDFEPHQEWRCAQTPDFPQGIPLWKIFALHFWGGARHPLGGLWTMSPEPYSTFPRFTDGDQYLLYTGYSIEAYCNEPVPASARDHRAYILAKKPSYFEHREYTFSNHVFADIKAEIGLDFVAGTGDPDSPLPDSGITNIGIMNGTTFRDVLGHSKALVGIGQPPLSPTPYDALCMGVPFINSITRWDEEEPDNQSKWAAQHEGLLEVGPPYVYHVKQGDKDGLKTALEGAVGNPIGRFVPRRMSKRAMQARYRMLVETDWEAVYEDTWEGDLL